VADSDWTKKNYEKKRLEMKTVEDKRSTKIEEAKKDTVTALDTLQSQEMIDQSSVDHNFGEEMKYDTDFKASATKPINIERLQQSIKSEVEKPVETKKKGNSSSYFSESYDSSDDSSDNFDKRDIQAKIKSDI
jgi:hypothetical protein